MRFTPILGAKRMQTIAIDLVVDDVDFEEPEIVSPAGRLQVDGLETRDYQVYPVENALADKLCALLENMRESLLHASRIWLISRYMRGRAQSTEANFKRLLSEKHPYAISPCLKAFRFQKSGDSHKKSSTKKCGYKLVYLSL